jgi:5-hydroxyisourate hydrolase-like protein (transthyretin family)
MMTRISNKAFTLVEVLVSSVVIIAIAVATGTAITTLFKAGQISGDRSAAVNLLQKSHEELLRASQIFFDSFESCQFPSAGGSGCGFQDIRDAEQFPDFRGFQREAVITREQNSTELKRARVTVRWTDFRGQSHEVDSVFLIPRPPDDSPGNIIGEVSSSDPAVGLLSGARVRAVQQESAGFIAEDVARDSLDSKNANFDLSSGGPFSLPAGTYRLTATASGHRDYTHPDILTVDSGSEIFISFTMEVLPDPAVITVSLEDFNTGSFVSFGGGSGVQLFSDGLRIDSRSGCSGESCSFSVEFQEFEEKAFTVNTDNSISSGWVGNFSCAGGGRTHEPEGWSSAQVINDLTYQTNCGPPVPSFDGGADSDRVKVFPGDEVTVKVRLVRVPTATISGRVVDRQGNPVPGAVLELQIAERSTGHTNSYEWPGKDSQSYTADSGGRYTLVVPAQEALYANDPSQYIKVRARARVTQTRCCDEQSQVTRYSPWLPAGPLYQGTALGVGNLVINTAPSVQNCGNLKGNILDAKQGLGLPAATVQVQSLNRNSDNRGDYIYQCSQAADGYRLLTGSHNVAVSRSGYYSFNNSGNRYYAPGSAAIIVANQQSNYNAKLWPIGRGHVRVTVVDNDSGQPLGGARVELRRYSQSSGSVSGNTDGNGLAVFQNFWETWPPAALPKNDPYFRYGAASHSIVVSRSGYYDGSAVVARLDSGQTVAVTVRLRKKPVADPPSNPGL